MNEHLTDGLVLLVALPAATLILCTVLRTPWRLVALLFLFVPFAAAVTAVVCPPDRAFPFLSIDFAKAVAGVYFFALLSLGYLAPLLGSIAWSLVRASSVASRVGRRTLLGTGAIAGAVVGLITMLLFTLASERLQSPRLVGLIRELKGWGVVGLVAGALSGVLVAVYSTPKAETARQH